VPADLTDGIFDLLDQGVKSAEAAGAQFVDARFDDLLIREIHTEKRLVRDVKALHRTGIGISVTFNGCIGYSFTVDLSKKSVVEAASKAFKIAKVASLTTESRVALKEGPVNRQRELRLDVKRHPKDLSLSDKKDLVLRAVESAQEHGKDVSYIGGSYGELYGKKNFTNSAGTETSWSPLVLDFRIMVVSKRGDMLVNGIDSFGGSFGLEAFDDAKHTPEILGGNAGKWAAEQLQAETAPAGKHRAICENFLTGVLAHESFGHLAEADFVVSKMSPLVGRLGEQLGSEHVTIVDEGIISTQANGGIWIPFDDQGVKASSVTIADRGKLKGYLHTRETASLMNAKPTGNARAVNYNYPPIVRMRNTYFSRGDLSTEEALELLGDGIYAVQTFGGQVDYDGTFMFNAARGYLVEKGEIKRPLREVALSGSILTFVKNIEGASKEVLIWGSYFGGCGKDEQFPLPVGIGGPHLVVRDVQFGGGK
jgi:TldD protein